MGSQWKILFNLDPWKQSTEVYLKKKKLNQDSPLPLDFNDGTFQTVKVYKHFDHSLNNIRDFNIHIDSKTNKCNKIINICSSEIITTIIICENGKF